jgi:hypothetical protein
MKQKTAMQILLDSINKELESNAMKDTEYYGGLEDVKDYILENFLLEKEKEQIMDARNDALKEKYTSVYNDLITYGQVKIETKTSEQYYNETYLKENK